MREYSILYLSRESFFRHEETLIVVGDRVREREEGEKKNQLGRGGCTKSLGLSSPGRRELRLFFAQL